MKKGLGLGTMIATGAFLLNAGIASAFGNMPLGNSFVHADNCAAYQTNPNDPNTAVSCIYSREGLNVCFGALANPGFSTVAAVACVNQTMVSVSIYDNQGDASTIVSFTNAK
jgi:hypothetical protein